MFPIDLAATLSGATISQLSNWRRSDLLRPEVSGNPVLYSFRDIMALRTLSKLRSRVPLQRIRKAFAALSEFDLTEHPSAYSLVTDDSSIFIVHDDGEATDLVINKGQSIITGLTDIFAPFVNLRGREVPDLVNPRPRLSLSEKMLGGFPAIKGTAVPYDRVTTLLRDGSVPMQYISHFYPSVSPADAEDAIDFEAEVVSMKRGAVA